MNKVSILMLAGIMISATGINPLNAQRMNEVNQSGNRVASKGLAVTVIDGKVKFRYVIDMKTLK